MEHLKKLRDLLDEDNQASLALVLDCVVRGRLDLILDAAVVALSVIENGERTQLADQIYRRVFEALRAPEPVDNQYAAAKANVGSVLIWLWAWLFLITGSIGIPHKRMPITHQFQFDRVIGQVAEVMGKQPISEWLSMGLVKGVFVADFPEDLDFNAGLPGYNFILPFARKADYSPRGFGDFWFKSGRNRQIGIFTLFAFQSCDHNPSPSFSNDLKCMGWANIHEFKHYFIGFIVGKNGSERQRLNLDTRPLFVFHQLNLSAGRLRALIGSNRRHSGGFCRNPQVIRLLFENRKCLHGGLSTILSLSLHDVGLPFDCSQCLIGHPRSQTADYSEQPVWHICRGQKFIPWIAARLGIGCLFLFGGFALALDCNRRWLNRIGCILAGVGWPVLFAPIPWDLGPCHADNHENDGPYRQSLPHNAKIVQQKLWTSPNLRYTINIRGLDMANTLSTDKKIAVIGGLAEGSSIRSIERITGVHRDTIMRLGVKVGQGCTALMDTKMRNLPCRRLEMDEIWGFVGKKERHVQPGDDPQFGDVWTFCAIDAETKLVPAFRVGDRDTATARAFVKDVAARMAYRVQISTDGLKAYVESIENAFGSEADYGQIVKTYGSESIDGQRRYSQPEFVSSEKKIIAGQPDVDLISTSYIERLNATTRLHMRRLTRLTLAFSKKRENFEAAVGLHFAYYNFVKRHNTLRCTPAMAAGVTGSFWSVADLVEAAA